MAIIPGKWVRRLRVSETDTTEPVCRPSTIEDFIGLLGSGPVGWGVWAAHDITIGGYR